MNLQWNSAALTHPGNARDYNQDAFLCRNDRGIWAVADGMGGHSAGDIASQTIIQTLSSLADSGMSHLDILTLTSMLEDVSEQLYQQNQQHQRIMGSTIAMASLQHEHCICLWAGDSRIYLHRDNQLQQLSTDHSYVEALIAAGKLQRKNAQEFGQKNVITRAIGVAESLKFDYQELSVQIGDKILLCSDGLYNEVDSNEIAAVLEYSHNVHQAATQLMTLALSRDANDNISIVVIEVQHE